jgi:hypothetical protein
MLQSPQSCLSQTPDGNGNVNLTVVAAVSTILDIYKKYPYPTPLAKFKIAKDAVNQIYS